MEGKIVNTIISKKRCMKVEHSSKMKNKQRKNKSKTEQKGERFHLANIFLIEGEKRKNCEK